jgi:hypothetical protein
MQYREGNTYRGEVPSSWLVNDGSYSLRIGSAVIRFGVSGANRNLYIGAGILSVNPNPISLPNRFVPRVCKSCVAAVGDGVGHHGGPFVQESPTREEVYKLIRIL